MKGWLNGKNRKPQQEVVRFNVCLRVLEMQGLPSKYKQYKVTLQRGQKLVTSGDIYADEECNMIRDDGMATTMQFVTSMQRAVSGIDFEEKEYKLKLQRVNSRSYHPSKTVAKTVINIAEACTRDNLDLRLEMESELDSSGPCWITISIDANTRKNDGDTASMYNSEASSMAGSEYSCNTSVSHVSDQDDQNLSDVNGADEDDDDEVEDRPAARREEKPVAPEKPVVPDRFELYKQRKAEQERKRQEEEAAAAKKDAEAAATTKKKQDTEANKQKGAIYVSSHPAAAIDGEGGGKEKREGAGAPQIGKKTDESRLEAIKRKQKEREEKEKESAAADKKKESEDSQALVPAKKAKEKEKEKEREEHAATAPRKVDVSERTSGVAEKIMRERSDQLRELADWKKESRFASIKLKEVQKKTSDVQSTALAAHHVAKGLREELRLCEVRAEWLADNILQQETAAESLEAAISKAKQAKGAKAKAAWIHAFKEQIEVWEPAAAARSEAIAAAYTEACSEGEDGESEGPLSSGGKKEGGGSRRQLEEDAARKTQEHLNEQIQGQCKKNLKFESWITKMTAEFEALKVDLSLARAALSKHPNAPKTVSPSERRRQKEQMLEEMERITGLLVTKQMAHANAEFEKFEAEQQAHKLQVNNKKLEETIANLAAKGFSKK